MKSSLNATYASSKKITISPISTCLQAVKQLAILNWRINLTNPLQVFKILFALRTPAKKRLQQLVNIYFRTTWKYFRDDHQHFLSRRTGHYPKAVKEW